VPPLGGGIENKMYYSTTCASPVGAITLASDENNLVGLWLEGQKYHGEPLSGAIAESSDIPVLKIAEKWLAQYFAGKNPEISELPLAPIGSVFRQHVWRILREIPYGEVITYGDIAKKVALKIGREHMSSRAVGAAIGHNPISIMIPCHRVVGSNGSLTGYAAGIHTKAKLLELEGVDMSRLFVPAKGVASYHSGNYCSNN
jgi:methylated-DNA-[protein]-cysteine S-methyltransferase